MLLLLGPLKVTENVSVSQVELRSQIQFYDGIKTADIHETLVKAAARLNIW